MFHFFSVIRWKQHASTHCGCRRPVSTSVPIAFSETSFCGKIYSTHISIGITFLCDIWAAAWDFQQCGMCDQQSLRSACAYAQSDQSLCLSLEYSMTVKLLSEHHMEFLNLKGGCTGLSESIHVKMLHCWKSHTTAHLISETSSPCACMRNR